MDLIDKYILEYSEDFNFEFSRHISKRIFDVEIEIDVFEYSVKHSHREKAHVVFKKGNLTYECCFCDSHDYENCFYPIILNSQRFIGFRKTLYGFTVISAETLSLEFDCFPESALEGKESFIIADLKQIDELLILEGCYWACPYECFVFECDKKLFLNVSKMYDLIYLDKTEVYDNKLVMYGKDENDTEKVITLAKQVLISNIDKHGKKDLESSWY